MSIQVKAPQRFTQSTHQAFHDNYASSLEVVPATAVLTDVNNVQVTSDSALVLGLFEEPPLNWGTTTTVPISDPDDYNVLNPDARMNTDTTRDQTNPIIATDGISGSHNVVVVWQDHRSSTANPDIYLRWSNSEKDAGSEHPRQDWGDNSHELKVNEGAPGTAKHQNPVVAVAPNGDVVIAWQDNSRPDRQPGDDWDIYLQQYHIDAGGLTTIGANKFVTTTVCPNASETYPDIAVDKESNFYVVWQSRCTQQYALWASKGVPASGQITWYPGRYVVDPSARERRDPKISAAPAVRVIIDSVTWPNGPPPTTIRPR